MNLRTCYKYAAIIPSLLAVTGYIIYAIIYVAFDLGRDYKSEWLTANALLPLTVLIVFINAIFTCCLSATLFLNAYRGVRSHAFLSFLAWFLVPMLWLGGLLINQQINSEHYFDEESIFVWFNTLPYIFGLLVTFIRFRKSVDTTSS